MEIKRDRYLQQLIESRQDGFIKVVTGIRRCGKSYLLNVLFYHYLLENGIAPRKYFYPLTSDFSIIRSKYPINETPVAKKVAEEILTLPLYAGLTIDEVNHICDIILEK